MNIAECLNAAQMELASGGVDNARREAASLLSFAISRDRTFLIAHPEYELTNAEKDEFDRVIGLRKRRVPFQHITGKQEFYGLDFRVSPDVLIPRPETEILVESAIENLRKFPNPRFCEIGVGSGCISIAVLVNLPNSSCVAVDVSRAALRIAADNAATHNVLDRMQLIESDVFGHIGVEKFDAVLSNPPYIPQSDMPQLQAEVRDHDPSLALTDGDDGLTIIREIIKRAPEFLKADGLLSIEIGHDQSPRVSEMFSGTIWHSVTFLKDLQNFDRIVTARLS